MYIIGGILFLIYFLFSLSFKRNTLLGDSPISENLFHENVRIFVKFA